MEVEEILKKYGKKIEGEIQGDKGDLSSDYIRFKRELVPELSRYEKACQNLGGLKIKASRKDEEKIRKNIEIAHLEITPTQVVSLAVVMAFLIFFVGSLVFAAIYFATEQTPYTFLFMIFIVSGFVFYYFYSTPQRLANLWRLKASSQMVPCILYLVVYMKHTSNLERAIAFASKHLQYPLALDFRKIFWNIETGKYTNINESLNFYLETWKDYSPEVVEAFHLIESSLFEPSEARRIEILEKSLQVVLDGVYNKMLKFSRDVRSPLTTIYMLGVVLPTLALALLPLASTLLQGAVKWYHVALLFDVLVPFFVFYLTDKIMAIRPGGYGETGVLELNPLYEEYKSKTPFFLAFLIVLPFFLIGSLPFIFQSGILENIGLAKDYSFDQIGLSFLSSLNFFDFKEGGNGPFGIVALIFSLFITLGIALFFSIAYEMKTKNLIKTRDESRQLEKEFGNSLFQLGNRIGGGNPAEIAFGKVAESTQGQVTSKFFNFVNSNIHQYGMSLEAAIFDKRSGALIFFPSQLIATSMEILVESVRKGLNVAAVSLISISDYVKNIDKINERMRDLLAEVVSDMKSNMTFLAPVLAGIVIGLAGMITTILNKLQYLLQAGQDVEVFGMANLSGITEIFNVNYTIPPYFLQIIFGIYIIEMIFILTSALVKVDSGDDKLQTKYELSRNLKRGIFLYLILSFISIIALSVLAAIAVGGMTG